MPVTALITMLANDSESILPWMRATVTKRLLGPSLDKILGVDFFENEKVLTDLKSTEATAFGAYEPGETSSSDFETKVTELLGQLLEKPNRVGRENNFEGEKVTPTFRCVGCDFRMD